MRRTSGMGSARLFSYVTLFVVALGCSEQEAPAPAPTYGGRGRVASTQGGAVVMTYDERIAVVANRTAGVVSVLALDPTQAPNAMVRRTTQIDVGADAKPWAAVIGADDDTAYVLLRGSQTVVRLAHLHDRPTWEQLSAVPVGAEPTSIAITPSGSQLYVANFGDGTVSMITTADLVAHQYTNLNLTVAKSGLLGSSTNDPQPGGTSTLGMWTDAELGSVRPGLAHPRALAMTDNGDNEDAGETLYVTDFFAMPRAGAPAGDPDLSHQGVVYAIDIDSGQVKTHIPLAPLSTGFSDATGSMTSCYPNQLYAATVSSGRLYVTHVCASPRGPTGAGPKDPNNTALATANFKTLVHAAVSVVDTTQNVELTAASGVLTKPLVDLYDAANPAVPDRRMPLIPNDVALGTGVNGDPTLYVSALGADAVFAVDVAGDVLRPDPAFIDLRPAGHLPVGVALSRTAAHPFALVMNDYSNAVTVIGLDATRPAAVAPSAPQEAVLDDANEGHRVFATGLDVWSLGGQAWSSCESCHPEGLSDGVTWQFSRGPRRTISTAGTYSPDGTTRRILLWTANVDEIHDVEAIARGVSGGIGSVLWNTYTFTSKANNDCRLLFDGTMASPLGGVDACPAPEPTTFRLNGMNGTLSAITRRPGDPACTKDTTPCDLNDSRDWDHIDEFIRSVKAPRAPKTCASNAAGKSVLCLNSDYVAAGRDLFTSRGCAACHGGPNFTISRTFFTPSLANNGQLPFAAPAADAVDPPEADLAALRGRLRTEKYDAGTLAAVNPPAAAGPAFFRSYAPAVGTTSTRPALDYLYGTADTINCALRAVGTFPAQVMGEPANFTGIVATGAPAVTESRVQLVNPPADAAPGTLPTYQETLSLGKDGFNVPALVGMAATSSFFHAGNARTLEELFSTIFAKHHANPAITKSDTLTPAETKNLVSYLLSLDDDAPTVAAAFDSGTPAGADLCGAFKE